MFPQDQKQLNVDQEVSVSCLSLVSRVTQELFNAKLKLIGLAKLLKLLVK